MAAGFILDDNVVFFNAAIPTQWNSYKLATVTTTLMGWDTGNQNGFLVLPATSLPWVINKYHTITYNYNAGAQTITVTDDNGTDDGGGDDTTTTIATNVSDLTFSYFDADGNATAAVGDIRKIQVSITVVDNIESSMTATLQTLSGPLGSVRYTEAFLSEHPIAAEDLRALRQRVQEQAEVYPTLAEGTEVTAVAGTATTLAALELALDPYDPARVEGYQLGAASLERWIARLAALSVPERRRLPGLESGRADVIVAGLVILAGVLVRVGAAEFRVSGLGLRHGVALRLLDATAVV